MNDLKEKGNDAFKQNQFRKAVNYYTQAIDSVFESDKALEQQSEEELMSLQKLIKSNDVLQKCFNNRCQCYLKLGDYKEAVDDATKCMLIYSLIYNSLTFNLV